MQNGEEASCHTAFRGDDNGSDNALDFVCFLNQRVKTAFGNYARGAENAQSEMGLTGFLERDAHFAVEVRLALRTLGFLDIGPHAGSRAENLWSHYAWYTTFFVQKLAKLDNPHGKLKRALGYRLRLSPIFHF